MRQHTPICYIMCCLRDTTFTVNHNSQPTCMAAYLKILLTMHRVCCLWDTTFTAITALHRRPWVLRLIYGEKSTALASISCLYILNCVFITFESSITCSLHVLCMLAYSNIRKLSPSMKNGWWSYAYVPVIYLHIPSYTVIYHGICRDIRVSGFQMF